MIIYQRESEMHGYTEGSRVKLSTGDISIKSAGLFSQVRRTLLRGAMGKSAGVFEAKQKLPMYGRKASGYYI